MATLVYLLSDAYKRSVHYENKQKAKMDKRSTILRENELTWSEAQSILSSVGGDYECVPVTTYKVVKKTPYNVMVSNFKQTSLVRATELATKLSGLLETVRAVDLIFEPLHVRFVGKAGQCKTQYALQVMKLLDSCGLIGVTRTATDSFFDDIVKPVRNMTTQQRAGVYVYHKNIADREKVDLDAVFLDEVNAKKHDDPGMQIIMEAVTPMKWKPKFSMPPSKGKIYKPSFWLSTANHEITEHEYCIPAVLRRTHKRYVVSGGRLFDQTCYKILDATGTFDGGFETCHGVFGRWTESTMSASRAETVSAETKSVTCTVTTSNNRVVRIADTFNLVSLVCKHCVEVSFEQFMESTLTQVVERISVALETHNQTSALVDNGTSQSGDDLLED